MSFFLPPTGHFALPIRINTCQRPDCDVPKSLTFGPIQLNQWGSCCLGSYCNRNKSASDVQNATRQLYKVIIGVATVFTQSDSGNGKEGTPPEDEIGAGSAGPPFNRILTPPPQRAFEWERIAVAEAVRFQSCPFCPLLVAFGIAVLGAW